MTPEVKRPILPVRENNPYKGRLEGYTLAISYQRKRSEEQRDKVRDALEAYVQEGARQMLAAVLEEEVSTFLGRHRYERGKAFRGYRNGYLPSREVTVGLGPVEVEVPRVTQVPPDVAPQGFQSQIVRRY